MNKTVYSTSKLQSMQDDSRYNYSSDKSKNSKSREGRNLITIQGSTAVGGSIMVKKG